MKNLVIWGSGTIAKKFLEARPDIKPDYLIDEDPARNGKTVVSCKVRHLSDPGLYLGKRIILACDNCEDVAKRLRMEGLLEGRDFVLSSEMTHSKRLYDYDLAVEMEKNLGRIALHRDMYAHKPIMVARWTYPKELNNHVIEFAEHWSKERENSELVLAQEASKYTTKKITGFYSLRPICLPFFCDRSYFPRFYNYYISGQGFQRDPGFFCSDDSFAETYDAVSGDDVLAAAAVQLREAIPSMPEGYEFYVARYVHEYFSRLFRMLQTRHVYLWNEFAAVHRIIRHAANQQDIDTRYMEFGVLPGMFQVDEEGQMGESWPVTHSQEFLSLPVSEEELSDARRICRALYFTEDNRKKQSAADIWESIGARIDLDRPIVLYAGQADCDAGIFPYTETSRTCHSPSFVSSDDAARFLATICKENNWNLVYKLHPIMWSRIVKNGLAPSYPENVILLPSGDINKIIDWCDVLVTIASTANYVALVRRKPVVMLGYNQVKDKGCTYQAFTREDVEPAIQAALSNGFTDVQQNAFYRHVAQLRKYYLHDGGRLQKLLDREADVPRGSRV